MNKTNNDIDPFAAGFEADDDFSLPSDQVWKTIAASPAEPDQEPEADPDYASVVAVDEAYESPSDYGRDAEPAANRVAEMQAGIEASMASAAPSDLPMDDASIGSAGVPRIAIHVFTEQAETAAAASRGLSDRRMARATSEVLPGGLPAAILRYQNQATPALVVVESLDSGAALLSQLDQLAEVCDPGTKVMVIGSTNDITLYRELMRRGVSEYLVPPLQPLQLITAITTLYADPSAPFTGRAIAVVGAKGGVGASTLAHNLAYSFAERLMSQTVLVDFDLPFGTAGLDFNQDPLQGVANALTQPDRLDPVLLERMMAKCTERLSLFAAPSTLDDDYEISAEAFEEVASKIRATAPFVIMDMPHLWSTWMRRTLLSADEVIIVATPDLASLRNAKNLIDLVRHARPNDGPPRLVLNQVGMPGRPEIPVKDFGDALGVIPTMVLPFDPKLFGQAANNGQMLDEINPKSKCAEGVNQLASLIGRREVAPLVKKSVLGGLFRKK